MVFWKLMLKLLLVFQVIPSILDQTSKGSEEQPHTFAYIFFENTKVKESKSKTLCGQILECNLTKSRIAGGAILGEVFNCFLISF